MAVHARHARACFAARRGAPVHRRRGALEFVHEHREDIDAYLEQRKEFAAELCRAMEAEAPYEEIRQRHLARRTASKGSFSF